MGHMRGTQLRMGIKIHRSWEWEWQNQLGKRYMHELLPRTIERVQNDKHDGSLCLGICQNFKKNNDSVTPTM